MKPRVSVPSDAQGLGPLGRPADRELILRILEAVRSVRFGQVQIIIHDSQVVQIDTTEKVRLL